MFDPEVRILVNNSTTTQIGYLQVHGWLVVNKYDVCFLNNISARMVARQGFPEEKPIRGREFSHNEGRLSYVEHLYDLFDM